MLNGDVDVAVNRVADGADVGGEQLVQVAFRAVLAARGRALVLGKLVRGAKDRPAGLAFVVEQLTAM